MNLHNQDKIGLEDYRWILKKHLLLDEFICFVF